MVPASSWLWLGSFTGDGGDSWTGVEASEGLSVKVDAWDGVGEWAREVMVGVLDVDPYVDVEVPERSSLLALRASTIFGRV